MKVRLLLVDDHGLFREGLARLLQSEEGFEVVGNVATIEEALQVIASREVDLVLLDWDLGQQTGGDFLSAARKAGFAGRVLLVTAGVDDREAARVMREGVAGVFMKHSPPTLLAQGIREVMSGKVWFEQDFLRRVLVTTHSRPSGETRSKFTDREKQVLALVFEGLANKEIADRLTVSESSVKATLQQLFSKTGVRTRSQLVRIALEQYRDQL